MCIQTLCFNKLRKTRVSILVKPGCRARKWVKCNAVFIFCECTIYFHMLPLAWESKSTQICISQGISSSRNTRSNNHMQNGQNGATNRRLTSRTLIGGKAHRWAISHAWASLSQELEETNQRGTGLSCQIRPMVWECNLHSLALTLFSHPTDLGYAPPSVTEPCSAPKEECAH